MNEEMLLGQLCGVVNAEAHLQPLVSYCLMLLMKWTFFGTLGPGDPDTFLSLAKKNVDICVQHFSASCVYQCMHLTE